MELPSELQYEILMDLPVKEILHYCQTSKDAQNICSDERFWNQKALHDFGIPISIPPIYRYLNLDKQVDMYPEPLIPVLLQAGLIDQIPILLDSMQIVSLQGNRVGVMHIFEEFIEDAVRSKRLKSVKVLLDYIKSRVPADSLSKVSNLFRKIFFEAIQSGSPELVDLASKDYNLERESQGALQAIYRELIESDNLHGLKYIQPLLRKEFPLEWIRHAHNVNSQKALHYLHERYRED